MFTAKQIKDANLELAKQLCLLAIAKRDWNTFIEFLEAGIPLDELVDIDGVDPISKLVAEGDIKTVENLYTRIKGNAIKPAIIRRHFATACRVGNHVLIRNIHTEHPFVTDDKHYEFGAPAPLQEACAGGHAEVVAWLINSKCNPNLRERINSPTPLMTAVAAGANECCRILLKGGADANALEVRDDDSASNALSLAIQSGADSEIIKILLDHRADANFQFNEHSESPLMYAVKHCSQQIVMMLISAGALVGSVCKGLVIDGANAIECVLDPFAEAVVARREDNAKTLIVAGCDPQVSIGRLPPHLVKRPDIQKIINAALSTKKP